MVVYGVQRFTPDLNVIVDYESLDLQALLKALEESGYTSDHDTAVLASGGQRKEWAEKTGNFCFPFIDPQAPSFRLDFFLQNPIPFADLRARAENFELEGRTLPVIGFEDLIELKKIAGRGQDLADIQQLELIRSQRPPGPDEDLESLREFADAPLKERLDWLEETLTTLGQFCALS